MSTKMIAIRIPDEVYDYVAKRAEKECRTVSNMIVSILNEEKTKDDRKGIIKDLETISAVCKRYEEVKEDEIEKEMYADWNDMIDKAVLVLKNYSHP